MNVKSGMMLGNRSLAAVTPKVSSGAVSLYPRKSFKEAHGAGGNQWTGTRGTTIGTWSTAVLRRRLDDWICHLLMISPRPQLICRYSPVNPGTGLHPRPGNPPTLALFFPEMINQDYSSTVYASRKGELMTGVQDRADLFAEAWPSRIEAEMPEVTSAVIFSHAATVIALGRAVSLPQILG